MCASSPILTTHNEAAATRVAANHKRAKKLATAKHFNREYYKQVNLHLQANGHNMTPESKYHLHKYRRDIGSCASNSLWREHENKGLDFIAAQTCKNKYCSVCNMIKAQTVRRKYRQFLEKNQDLMQDFDFMHLTLTVPHMDGTWRGKRVYIKEIMAAFNSMRKRPFWKKSVYAGEFGVEMTRNNVYEKIDGVKVLKMENGKPVTGLHIHIHSLILVRKGVNENSRELLHKNILIEWNRLTRKSETLVPFDPKSMEDANRLAPIARSVKDWNTRDEYGNYIQLHFDRITPYLCKTGATMIGLETIYLQSNTAKDGYKWSEAHKSYIHRIEATDGIDAFMRAMLETIKYHFKPSVFQKGTDLDLELLEEILPEIHGQPLYQKFGAFSGNAAADKRHPDYQMLNLNTKVEDDIQETLEELAHTSVINPITLEPAEEGTYSYIVTSPSNIRFSKEKNTPHIKYRGKVKRLETGMVGSLTEMLTARYTMDERREQHGIDYTRHHYERELIDDIFYLN